jgi:hypothetical protein
MPHDWLIIKLGRVCTKCSGTQANGEFVDDETCPSDKPFAAVTDESASDSGEEPDSDNAAGG